MCTPKNTLLIQNLHQVSLWMFEDWPTAHSDEPCLPFFRIMYVSFSKKLSNYQLQILQYYVVK